MRFDPKLIRPAEAPLDASGELDLPDDLRELAAQLRDDADFLAACYPSATAMAATTPVAAVELPASATSDTRRRAWWLATGVLSLAVLVVALVYRPAAPDRSTATLPALEEIAASGGLLAVETGAPRWAASPAVAPPGVAPPFEGPSGGRDPQVSLPSGVSGPRIGRLPWAPTTNIGEVSGPELEGLLDLWQNDDEAAEVRISI